MSNSIDSLSVVIPTYNEAANVAKLVRRLKDALAGLRVEVLFVDDSPTQETVEAIRLAEMELSTPEFQVHWYYRGEDSWGGLSGAVSDGLYQALYETVVVMDGDLQHPPEAIPSMLAKAESTNSVVIASRYCDGGSAHGLSGVVRGLVSWGSTKLAKMLFPLALRGVTDPMTGFFLVRRSALDLDLLKPRGFKILLEILARHRGLGIGEVPFRFAERTSGKSKGSFKRGLEYLMQLLHLRFDTWRARQVAIVKNQNADLVRVDAAVATPPTVSNDVISEQWSSTEETEEVEQAQAVPRKKRLWHRLPTSVYFVVLFAALIDFGLGFSSGLTLSALLVIASLALFVQGCTEVWRTLYIYRQPDNVDRLRFPTPGTAHERFCIIVPARHESGVLASTLYKLAEQTHPNTDIITVICDDDYDTLRVAFEVQDNNPRVTVMQYPLGADPKPNKPKQLNYVFNQIKDQGYTVVGVIDAEDTVHPELLMHVDAAFRDSEVGIVQGGVQLMNHDSSWYSLHNVLEYYRWFNSAMAFQADYKFMPLGGNTVFIRENLLRQAGGWPETLTEDCSLGVLLSTRYQTKVAVHYEPWLATREETPDSLKGLFKQRVRWNQGFFHEWYKGVWRQLPTFQQRLLASYVLLSPVILALISLFLPISLFATLFWQAPVGLAMLMYLPWIPVSLLAAANAVFLRDFGKAFDRKILLRQYAILFVTHIAYQVVLNAAAFWSIVRELKGETSWYKSTHTGQHRVEPVRMEPVLVSEEGAGDV